MITILRYSFQFVLTAISSTLLLVTPPAALFFITSTNLQAQVLEEIVVSAQRREQSLQDVPIAIDVYSAEYIQKEGFNNLAEMSAFTPGVFVNESGDQGTDVFIRGFGTVGRNWANDSATPLFLDNVQLGQASMGTLGFMDAQRVEILKGPQPIHFGMNATGGAISIVSARPSREWDGYAYAELGQAGDWKLWKRSGSRKLDAAVGGPLTDSLSFRLAGSYSTRDGHLRDSITGYPMGYRNFVGGRLSLQWEPNENLTVYGKVEMAQQMWGDTTRVCRRNQGLPNRFTRTGLNTFNDVESDPSAMWLDYADGGTGMATPHLELDECGDSYGYVGQTDISEQPPVYARQRDTTTGFLDIRLATAYFLNNVAGKDWTANPVSYGRLPDNTGGPLFSGYYGSGTGLTSRGYIGGLNHEPINYGLEFNYRFDNDIEIQWTNGYMDSWFMDNTRSRNTPLYEQETLRMEDYRQKSSELRIAQYGGAIEWMVGGFIQKEKLRFTSLDLRNEVGWGSRVSDNRQDATWSSVFGNITYNFYENRLSLDAGIRYSHTKKDVDTRIQTTAFIYDVTPCTGRTTGPVANRAHPDVWKGDTTDWGGLPVQDVTPTDCIKGVEPTAVRISAEEAMFLVPSLPGREINYDNLWFVPFSGAHDAPPRLRNTPATWRGNYTTAVGFTPWDPSNRAAERWDTGSTWSHWDPQVVLRYRPTSELSTYFKYATAFKAGAFDLQFGATLPTNIEDFTIEPEYSETFELGASGTLFDSQVRYQATLFRVDFDDLIATTTSTVSEDRMGTMVINIGSQRAQGLELDGQWMATGQLQVGLNFSYLDSRFTYYPNANCTEHEFRNYQESGCQITLDPDGGGDITNPDDSLFALIDRAGDRAAYAPEFSITSSVDHWFPFRGYKVDTGATGTASTWYYTDFRGFNLADIHKNNFNLNLHAGIGDMDGKWRLGLALRNLLEPRSTFRPEHTSDISELGSESLSASQVKSVALTFKYNFFD